MYEFRKVVRWPALGPSSRATREWIIDCGYEPFNA